MSLTPPSAFAASAVSSFDLARFARARTAEQAQRDDKHHFKDRGCLLNPYNIRGEANPTTTTHTTDALTPIVEESEQVPAGQQEQSFSFQAAQSRLFAAAGAGSNSSSSSSSFVSCFSAAGLVAAQSPRVASAPSVPPRF